MWLVNLFSKYARFKSINALWVKRINWNKNIGVEIIHGQRVCTHFRLETIWWYYWELREAKSIIFMHRRVFRHSASLKFIRRSFYRAGTFFKCAVTKRYGSSNTTENNKVTLIRETQVKVFEYVKWKFFHVLGNEYEHMCVLSLNNLWVCSEWRARVSIGKADSSGSELHLWA